MESKVFDYQAGAEAALTMLLPALGGSGTIYGAGILDTAMTFSPAKVLLDAELFRQVRRVTEGIKVDDNTLALDVIKKVGPRGSYIAEKHTAKNFRKEGLMTELFDRRSFGKWEEDGSKDAGTRASEKAMDIITNYKPTPLKPEVQKKIDDILEAAAEEKGYLDWYKNEFAPTRPR